MLPVRVTELARLVGGQFVAAKNIDRFITSLPSPYTHHHRTDTDFIHWPIFRASKTKASILTNPDPTWSSPPNYM